MTIKELLKECQSEIKNGNGDKEILISNDDEGNGYHTLYYGFTKYESYVDMVEPTFHDKNNTKNVILLG